MRLFSRSRKDKDDKSSKTPERTDSPAPAEERSGLFILHECSHSEKQAIDIVAVHGLGGHWKSTWTGASDRLWLRDFLPNQLNDAGIKSRIMSFGYDSRTIFTKAVTDIDDAAAMFLDRIDGERQSAEGKATPLILIAHSLGGIVVKKAMILAHERSSYYGHLLASIKAVVFFGVPHQGANLAFWLEFPARLLEYGQLGFGGNTAYVSALKRNSTAFASISDSFIERGSHLIIRTFYETEKMGNQLIVDKDSARLRLPNEIAVGVADSNHKVMCKFDSAESQKYRPIWISIRGIAQDILKGESKSNVKEGLVPGPFQTDPNFVGRQETAARADEKFHAPQDRRSFEIVLICALPLEAECVQEVFDKFWEDEGKKYGKAAGDPNVYTAGVIGEHNVVLAYMPGMGTTSAAAVAGSLRVSFPNIKLALVVGICGGMPYGADQEEIVLGDVIISQALVQYDFGRQYPGGFKRKKDARDTLGRPSPEIRAVQAKLGTSRYKQRMQNNITIFLQEIQQKLPKTKHPGQENDILYRSSYVHQHHSPATCDKCGKDDEICELALKMECEDLGCESIMRVTRNRSMGASTKQPMVHFGIMGSGNTVMKSGQHRDQMARADGIIAFEMEGVGVWDYFPSIVIKGVCDYADSHKRKGWQRYAAATAAACTKAFLVEWSAEDARTGSDELPDSVWHIAFDQIPGFVGRTDELKHLQQRDNSPLLLASAKEHTDIVRQLLENGADVTARDESERRDAYYNEGPKAEQLDKEKRDEKRMERERQERGRQQMALEERLRMATEEEARKHAELMQKDLEFVKNEQEKWNLKLREEWSALRWVGFEDPSTRERARVILTLVSIPLPAWDLIPDHAACHYVGLIKSENLCQHESVQQLFAEAKSHSASATSPSVCPGQQTTWSDCSTHSGSTQLHFTRTQPYTEPIFTPQDSPKGSSSHEVPSADNTYDRSLTDLEKVAASNPSGTQSGLPQLCESSVAFRDANDTCKDIDTLESTYSKNNMFSNSQIEPKTEKFMVQESSLNASNMHGSRRGDWRGTAEEHQDYTYPISNPPFDALHANVQPWISTPISVSPTRVPTSLGPWNELVLQHRQAQSHSDDIVSENGLFQHSHNDEPVIKEGLLQKSQTDSPVNGNHLFQQLTSQEYDIGGDDMGGVQHWDRWSDEFVAALLPDSLQDFAADEGQDSFDQDSFDQDSELTTASRPSSPGSWSIGSSMASVITGPSSLGRSTGRSSPGSRSMGSTMASVITGPSSLARRTGPLTGRGLRGAKFMRLRGSCYRCFIMKEKCVLDTNAGVCRRCRTLENSNIYRTWELPCSRLGLDQRGIFMLPKALALPLTTSQVRNFVKNNTQGSVSGSAFKLSLTIGFGEPLRLDVVEFVPRGQETTRMVGFRISSTGERTALWLESPPILPVLIDKHYIQRHINHLVDMIIREEDSELPEHCFPEAHDLWQREILTIICQYYREYLPNLQAKGYSGLQTLRWALKLTVFNHIMCHPFIVPDDEVGILAHQLRDYHVAQSAEWICPRLTNRVIKHILVPMVKRSIDQVLDGLQKMLRARRTDSSAWDPAFCVVFLCLIVVGKTQASLVERAAVGLLNDDDSFTLDAAASEITEMEAELSTHLIGMFHLRFGTMRKMGGYNPLSRDPHSRPQVASQLAESVRLATDSYGYRIFETLDLNKLSLENMKEQNVIRQLAKFMQPFFLDAQFEEGANPEKVQMETAQSEKAQPERKKVLPTSE